MTTMLFVLYSGFRFGAKILGGTAKSRLCSDLKFGLKLNLKLSVSSVAVSCLSIVY